MKKIKPKIYTKAKKLLNDLTVKKKYLIPYGTLNFYVRHDMIVDKLQETISFKQSKWLEKYINFITQRKKKAKKNSKENSIIYSTTLSMEKRLKMY